jgi:flagellar biosynthesis protein FlhF
MPNAAKSGNLYVKSFFAASVPAAMEQARRELGADALLLNSREAPAEARHLGEYEVVFGAWPELQFATPAAPVAAAAPPVTAPAPAAPAPPSQAEEVQHRVHEIRQIVGRFRPAAPPRVSGELSVADTLIHSGVDTELAQDIERGVRRRLVKPSVLDIARPHGAGSPEVQAATVSELASRVEVRPEIGRITALVGPTGSGKTTTLVKLAVSQCLRQGHPVRLISADNLRIGGAEQLRTYANILGVPFQAVESTVALAQAIDSTPANTWLLIDTPGFSAALLDDLGAELCTFLSRRQDIDTHVVLTASTDRAGRAHLTDRFSRFRPGKLIFTRLDEASSTATVFCEAARTRMPLSFLCHGQSVPEDLAPASKELIVDSLVRQLPLSLQAVA